MNTFRMLTTSLVAVAALMLMHQTAVGQAALSKSKNDTAVKAPSSSYGVWKTVEDNKLGERLRVMRLKVYPQAAPVPALRHRLVPDPADRTDGNSAPAYLKAMGFFEQTNARIALSNLLRKWHDEATEEQRADYDYPPDSWREMSPDSLPLDEVKRYLKLISFQEPLLFDAARRKNYAQDRAMEREPNPIGYLLPEVQQMRELARQQIVRLRYAIAQNRIDDAVEIVGQMLAMANHIGQDEFMVSSMVGVAIQSMATSVVERLLPRWTEFTSELNTWNQTTPTPDNLDSFQFASRIATQYAPARRFLSEACGMSKEQLDSYPATQITFLAMVKYHEIAMDEATALFYLPYSGQQNYQGRRPVTDGDRN